MYSMSFSEQNQPIHHSSWGWGSCCSLKHQHKIEMEQDWNTLSGLKLKSSRPPLNVFSMILVSLWLLPTFGKHAFFSNLKCLYRTHVETEWNTWPGPKLKSSRPPLKVFLTVCGSCLHLENMQFSTRNVCVKSIWKQSETLGWAKNWSPAALLWRYF